MNALQASGIRYSIEQCHGRGVCTVYSRRTVIRVASVPVGRITGEWIHGHFPYGVSFNESTHVFSHEVMGGVVFMAALPLETVWDAVAECEKRRIKPVNITRIDVIERQLFKRYMGRMEPFWICLALEGGVRVLTMINGLPFGAHFVSEAPAFREAELSRIAPPQEAVLIGGCGWLSTFLSEAGVALLEAF